MMVDLAIVFHQLMPRILNITKSPGFFSHIARYALAENYRKAPDDVTARLPENGGVLMVMFAQGSGTGRILSRHD